MLLHLHQGLAFTCQQVLVYETVLDGGLAVDDLLKLTVYLCFVRDVSQVSNLSELVLELRKRKEGKMV